MKFHAPASAPARIAKIVSLAFVFVVAQIALHAQAQSALQKQDEAALTEAERALTAVQASATATDSEKAAALKEKAMALDNLGRAAEALDLIKQAEALAPDDFSVQLHKAIILDASDDHQAARETYDKLFEKLQDWHMRRAALIKKGEKPEATPEDRARLAVGLEAPQASALNYVFLGNYAKALAQFTRDYESVSRIFSANGDSDYDAMWRLWLTAKIRGEDGMRAKVAVEEMAGTLVVDGACYKEMVNLWRGKGHWQKILEAIKGMKISDGEKENYLTEAHFFMAGYYRYIKHDNETALELLDAENARPFNGCVERLFIKREIAELRK